MPDPTPLQLMDRLLDALKEAGIWWCQGAHAKREDGSICSVDYAPEVAMVCMEGALMWARRRGVLTFEERQTLFWSLTQAAVLTCRDLEDEVRSLIDANDDHGWDFARFREELARREASEE